LLTGPARGARLLIQKSSLGERIVILFGFWEFYPATQFQGRIFTNISACIQHQGDSPVKKIVRLLAFATVLFGTTALTLAEGPEPSCIPREPFCMLTD
jgi:hypothetical protein